MADERNAQTLPENEPADEKQSVPVVPPAVAATPPAPGAAPVADNASQAQQPTSGLAIAGLVLGILAILGAFIPLLNILTAPFAIIGLILAIIGFLGINKGKYAGRGIAIAGIVLGAVALVVTVGMYGCAGAIAGSSGASSSSSATETASTAEAESSASQESSTPSASASAELEKDAITLGNISFRLPRGWVTEKNDKGANLYYPAKGDHTSMIYPFASTVETDGVEQTAMSNIGDRTLSSAGEFEEPDIRDIEVSGYPAKLVTTQGTINDLKVSLQMCVICLPGKVTGLLCVSKNGLYDAAISECIDSLSVQADQSSGQSSTAQEPAGAEEEPASDTPDSGEVSPDVKEALDSYEAFMDEYVEFMKRYKESGNAASMMADYTSFLQKYTDFSQKINAMDTSSMSAADYAYYIEVTGRVSKKLLDVSM